MNLENVYMWAKAMNWNDFKALVAKNIDNIPPTVESNNEYVVVNKNDLSSVVVSSVTTDKCLCELNAEGQQISGWCRKHHTDWL